MSLETLRRKREALQVGLQQLQAQLHQQEGAIFLINELIREMEAGPAEGSPDSPTKPATEGDA